MTASTPEPLTGAEVSALVAALHREIGPPTDRDHKWQPMISAGEVRTLLALAEDHARLVGVEAAVEALADRWTRDGLTHGRLLRAALDTTATKEGS